jgi:hypothetical protein
MGILLSFIQDFVNFVSISAATATAFVSDSLAI